MLEELDLYRESSGVNEVEGRIANAARKCAKGIKKRIWVQWDVFLEKHRPGLEAESPAPEVKEPKKKKRKRKRKSKAKKIEDDTTDAVEEEVKEKQDANNNIVKLVQADLICANQRSL